MKIEPAVFIDLTPEKSIEIQKVLIAIGCRWIGKNPKQIRNTDMPCISVDSDGSLHYHYKNKTLNLLYPLHSPTLLLSESP
jgi:hypothetical protein